MLVSDGLAGKHTAMLPACEYSWVDDVDSGRNRRQFRWPSTDARSDSIGWNQGTAIHASMRHIALNFRILPRTNDNIVELTAV